MGTRNSKSKSKLGASTSEEKYYRSWENFEKLKKSKTAYKPSSPAITTTYFHHISEMNEIAKGIGFLLNQAMKSAQERMKNRLDDNLESMLTRCDSLRQELFIVLEMSVYHVDLYVKERKQNVEKIYTMLVELEELVKEAFQRRIALRDVATVVYKISKATDEITKIH